MIPCSTCPPARWTPGRPGAARLLAPQAGKAAVCVRSPREGLDRLGVVDRLGAGHRRPAARALRRLARRVVRGLELLAALRTRERDRHDHLLRSLRWPVETRRASRCATTCSP